MANITKKAMDPTEAALSAIQEALDVRDLDAPSSTLDLDRAVSSAKEPPRDLDKNFEIPADAVRRTGAGNDMFLDGQPPLRSDNGRAESDDTSPRRAANDDRRSIGQVLRALQRRPSRVTYVVATVFALAWVFASFGFAWIFMPELQATMTSGGSAVVPALIGIGAVFLIPIIFFYVLAHMIWRSQELRVVAQSMAEVAIRLADPETAARESIVTVGQAIRREVAAMGDGVERALARAAELEALVHNEVSALERAYNNNEIRIQALLQDIATQRDTLVAQGEQVRNAITSVHLDLNQDIATVSERINERVQETAQRITRTLADKGEHITLALGHAGDTMISTLSERGNDLLERLETTSDQATRAIAGATESLTTSLNFKTDHIQQEFAGIASNLQHDMSQQLMGAARSFEESTTLVLDMMAARTQEMAGTLIDNGTQVSDTIAARVEDANTNLNAISQDFENRTGAVIDTIAARTESLTSTLDDHGTRISGIIAARVENATGNLGAVTEDLERRTTFIIDTMNQRTQEMAQAILDSSTQITDVIASRADDANSSLQSVSVNFEQDVDRVMAMMSARAKEIAASVVESGVDISETIAKRVEETNAVIRTSGDSLLLDMNIRGGEFVSNLEQTGARIADSIIARSNEVSETFRESGDHLVHAVDARGDAVKNMLAARLLAFEELFTHGGGELSEKITRDSTMLGNLITRHLTEFDRTVKTFGGELVERLGQRTQDVAAAMRTSIESFDGRVNAKGDEVAQTLDQRITRFEETFEGRTQALSDTLAARVTEITTRITEGGHSSVAALDGRANEATGTLDQQIARFEKLLIGRTEDVTAQVEARTKAAADMLRERLEELNSSITTNTADAERSLTALSANVSSIITGNAGDVERTLLSVSSEVARNFVGTAEEIAKVVGARAAEITGILDKNSGSLLTALTDKSREFADQVTGATDIAINQIESKAIVFTDTMFANTSEIAKRINDASEQATSSFSSTIRDLHDVTQSAIEQSKQAASNTVSDIRETHSMLSADVTALFERLREANILLQEVLSGAHENMSALEHTMVTRVSEFVSTMETMTTKSGQSGQQVEESIGKFHNVTTRVLGDLSQISSQFENHGRSLAQAVELIDGSNRRSDGLLGERKQALEALVTGLDARTGDLETRLRSFSTLLDESLEVATSRAREIARVVSESTSEGTQVITEQFELVRRNSEEERRRTRESMRSIYEQVSDEASTMFNQASERFTEIVHGMKHMASEMQRELETTRGELRRGILELPEETAESAAQMRRVIVDQIEALAELNRIVARHGRGLETAEITRRPAREESLIATSSDRREAPRPTLRQPASRQDLRQDTNARDLSARAEAVSLRQDYSSARSETTGGARTESTTPRIEMRSDARPDLRPEMGEPAPAATSPRRAESPSLSPAANNRGGWLSDLLSRASRDDEDSGDGLERDIARETGREEAREGDRTARHSIESLDSLSVDIARMIDHDAAAELWERYKRGERNVFTRRLYTLQGQKAFDEIRKKYRGEREFKQTVDRYISEFERLLDDVSRDDRGQVVARTYLTSETGKVYTMLAHAAGRFE